MQVNIAGRILLLITRKATLVPAYYIVSMHCESIAMFLSRITALLWLFMRCDPRMLA